MKRGCSRRELLAWMIGAPLAAEACKKRPRGFDGELLGQSLSHGHRWRDGRATLGVAQASGPVERVRVAIVGGGPSGLSAAWRLERLGEKRFVVLELEPEPGGTSAYGTNGVVPHPWGAHYVPMPSPDNHALIELLGEMNLIERAPSGALVGKETELVRAPEERVFAGGAWYEGLFPDAIASDADRAELDRFQREIDRWVGWRDAQGRRAFTIPISRGSDDPEVTALDRISAAAWLDQRGIQSPVVRWYVEYACRDDYGLSLADTSAWAMLFYFASRVPEVGGDSAPFLTWPEGNGRLVAHLSRVAGSRLRTRRLVTEIAAREDEVELAVLDVQSQKLSKIIAEQVIVAVPKFVARRLLRPLGGQAMPDFGGFSYGSWLVANIHLKRRPESRGFPFAWDNVLYDSPSLGYVVATHQRLADLGPTIWTYYLPFVDTDIARARTYLAEIDHKSACDSLLADLGRAHDGLEDCISRIDVWRWGHAMVRPTPGFVWSPGRRAAFEPHGRVHFAHSDTSAVGLFEEAQHHGIRAAEEVLDRLGHRIEVRLG